MSNAQSTFVAQLQQDILDDKVALILGTGYSSATAMDASNASWVSLLRNGLEFIQSLEGGGRAAAAFQTLLQDDDSDTDALIPIAQWLRSKFDSIPGEYADWLSRTVGSLTPDPQKLALSRSLPRTTYVMTTNYDTLCSATLDRRVLTWTDENALNELNRNPAKYVFHLHGVFREPRSIILSGGDYGRLEESNAVHELLISVARSHSLLLVGFGAGLNDPNFRRLINWLRENQATSKYRHYILLSGSDNARFDAISKLAARLTPIVYGETHDDLPPFLSNLSKHAASPQSVGRSEHTLAEDVSLYPTPPGVSIPPAVSKYLVDVLGDYRLLSDFQRRAVGMCAALVGQRSPGLLCAVTGTGKTTIARYAINLAIAHHASGIELLPTKALVAQEVNEWSAWATAWGRDSDRRLLVYGASRDYPENDRPVSRGRYDVAVAIYEKLGVYLVNGRTPLAGSGIAVVDELQMLAENSQRAGKLEAILTCIRLMSDDDRPALLGLSATLSAESTVALRSWLGVSEANIITSNQRPIPLDTFVVDPVGWKVQSDAHLLNLPGQAPPAASEYKHHGLDEKRQSKQQILTGKLPHVFQGELAATLVDQLLKRDPSRKIVCFVPSRTAAIELSHAIQALLRNRLGNVEKGSPWITGRFSDSGFDPELGKQKYNALLHSDLPNSEAVMRGLKTGVAPHSASFTATLRRLMEDEFRREDGLLRVLVATDTLAVGVNLPADTVIATSISGYSGSPRARRLLSPANLDNKAGRAGRPGMSSRPRGEFYILVPARAELQSVDGISMDELRRLATVEGVFAAYVNADERGAPISSQYRTLTQVSMLVLMVLCQDGFARELTAWISRVRTILESTLLAFEDAELVPTAEEVRDELQGRRLLSTRPNGKISLTGLGIALAVSSLDIEAASTLERLARLISANAGTIDVLWNACRSATIQETTEWVSLPPVAAKHYPSLKESVLRIANAYCSDEEVGRRYFGRLSESGKYPPPEDFLVEGSKVVSPELLVLLQSDGERATDADVTALLRALVAYEWSRGLPFSQIKARYSANVVSEERQPDGSPVSLKIHYSDVEQLCEQIAGLLTSASDVAVSLDGLDYSARARTLASQVECGLPGWLAPIARMRIPALHRERLTFMWNRQPPRDSIAEILDDEVLRTHAGITQEELDDARRVIEVREEESRTFRNRLAQRWSVVNVPGGEGDTFEDVSDALDKASTGSQYLEVLAGLLYRCGAKVEPILLGPQGFCFIVVRSAHHDVTIHAPEGQVLTREQVEAVRNREGLVLLRSRLSPDAFNEWTSPTRARFVQPEHILSILANLVDTRQDALDPDELVADVSRVVISSVHSDRWYIATADDVNAPPPFSGELPALEPASVAPLADDDTLE